VHDRWEKDGFTRGDSPLARPAPFRGMCAGRDHRRGCQEACQAHAARHVRRRRLRSRGSAGGSPAAGRGHRL